MAQITTRAMLVQCIDWHTCSKWLSYLFLFSYKAGNSLCCHTASYLEHIPYCSIGTTAVRDIYIECFRIGG